MRVGEQLLIAREAVVVAVGSGAAQPPIPGLAEVPIATLAHAVAPFPTRSELWLKFLEAYESERLALSEEPRLLAAAA